MNTPELIDTMNKYRKLLSNIFFHLFYIKEEVDPDCLPIQGQDVYAALKAFYKTIDDEYTLVVWYENPAAFFDIGTAYFDIFFSYYQKFLHRSKVEDHLLMLLTDISNINQDIISENNVNIIT